MKRNNVIRTKKCLVAIMAAGLSASMLAGCGSSGALVVDQPDAVITFEKNGDDINVSVENPWVDAYTEKNLVYNATGLNIYAPTDATNVHYSFLNTGDMAQVTYTYDNHDWTFRMQKTDVLTDISGLYYEWAYVDEVQVSGKDGMAYAYVDGADDSGMIDDIYGVQLINWYDAELGITYSLSTEGKDLNGMDIQVIAENLYALANEDESIDFMDAPNNDFEDRVGKTTFDSYDEIISLLEAGEGYAYINVMGYDGDVLAVTSYVYNDMNGKMATTECALYTTKADGTVRADSIIASGGTANPVAIDEDGVIYTVTHSSLVKYCYGNNSNGDVVVMCLGQVYADELNDNGAPVSVIGSYRTSNSVVNDDNLVDIDSGDVEFYNQMFKDYVANTKTINFTVVK